MNLRMKIALSASLITLGSLLLFIFVARVVLERDLFAHLDEELSLQARVVLEEFSARPTGKLEPEAISVLQLDSGISSAFAYRDGRLTWQYTIHSTPEPLHPEFLRSTLNWQSWSNGNWRVYSLRQGPLVVQIGHPLTGIRDAMARYDRASILSMILAAILAGIANFLMMMRASQSLARVISRVEHLDSDLPIPGTERQDEVGRLARALMTSVTRLKLSRTREARFLADASHELRTPVTALITDLEHTLAQPRSHEEDRTALKRALRTASHMRDLAANLLALTRAQSADTTPISKRQLDLLELVEDAVDRLMPLAVQKGLDLEVEGEQADLGGDATLLSRLVENLLGNAIKYTETGQVLLEVHPDKENVWLRVSDTGPGMSPEVLERLSEPYSRGDTTHQDSFGLGLAVVKTIVAAHGGHIEAESLVGLGTRILVRLPRQTAPQPTAPALAPVSGQR